MIKFFRFKRHNMINQDKTKKYLLYALGEIFLVVIGILIALQINNWNEGTKERDKEIKLLNSLQDDFLTTGSNLRNILQVYPQFSNNLKARLSLYGKNDEDLTDSLKVMLVGTGFTRLDIVESSLKVLLSSENLQLISNDSLKKQLTAYPSFIESFRETEGKVIDLLYDEHRPILESHISLADFFQSYYPGLEYKAAPSNFDELVQDRDFQNVLVKEIIYISRTAQSAQNLFNKTDEIIQLLQKQLQLKKS